MKGVAALPFAAVLAIALAGCGAGHRTPNPATTAAASSTASPAAGLVSATTNERLFADGLAASIPAIPAQAVADTLIHAYARFEHASGAASAAAGQPDASESVTQMAGGFKLCWSDTGNGSGCFTITQFTTNRAGQITGVSVDGQPVVGRIATAPAATSDGLTISDVVAYRLTSAQNVVVVTFKLTDDSYRPVNTSPALLASLGGASDDTNRDALPPNLAPGDHLYAAAGFDITHIGGLFCLEPNDGFGEHLPCTSLSKIEPAH